MSFGIREVAPILPDFMARYPEVSIDLHLSDALVDVIGDGFDIALRIGVLADSSLLARRLAPVPSTIVAAPSYLDRRGRPSHPADLIAHDCFTYAYLRTRDAWNFANAAGETVTVRPTGSLRVNNGDALLPAVIAGLGIAGLPAFLAGDALADGRLEQLLPDWTSSQSGLYLLTPPAGPRPVRIQVLADFLTERLSRPRR
jgi:DNA-binding transcriptional LysR family regulator